MCLKGVCCSIQPQMQVLFMCQVGRSDLNWHSQTRLPFPLDFLWTHNCLSSLGVNELLRGCLWNCLRVSLLFCRASTDPWSSVRKSYKCSSYISRVKLKIWERWILIPFSWKMVLHSCRTLILTWFCFLTRLGMEVTSFSKEQGRMKQKSWDSGIYLLLVEGVNKRICCLIYSGPL